MAGPLDLRGTATVLTAGAVRNLNALGGAMTAVASKAKASGTAATTYMGNAGKSAQHANKRMSRVTGGMSGTGMVGLGAAAGGLAFLRSEYDFQKQMNSTQAKGFIEGPSNKEWGEWQRHKDLVVELGAQYPATATEIAKGASQLKMAGMPMKLVNDLLEQTIQGAMASGESIKTVGMGVTDVMMGLGKDLNAKNFEHINNIMTVAQSTYAQDYTGFLAGFYKTAPLARVTGTSIEKLTGMLGVLADSGFKAEKGGTALRTMMIRLAAPTPAAIKQFKLYGIEYQKFRGKFDGSKIGGKGGASSLVEMLVAGGANAAPLQDKLTSILSNKNLLKNPAALQKALTQTLASSLNKGNDGPTGEMLADAVGAFMSKGFQNLDVEGIFKAIGGSEAVNDLIALKDFFGVRFTAQGASTMNSWFQIDKNTGKSIFDTKMATLMERLPGAVAKVARIMMQGLPGAVARLASSFDRLIRTMAASGAMDTVVWFFDSLRDGINWLSKTSPGVLKAVTLGLLGMAALAPIGIILSAVGGGIATLASSLGLLTAAVGGGIALFAMGDLFSGMFSGITEGLQPAMPMINDMVWGIQKLIGFTGPLGKFFGGWDNFGNKVGQALTAPLRFLNTFWVLLKAIYRSFSGTWVGRQMGLPELPKDHPLLDTTNRDASGGSGRFAGGFAPGDSTVPLPSRRPPSGLVSTDAPAQQAQASVNAARQAAAQIKAELTQGMHEAGVQAMAQFAAGISAGGSQAVAAARRVGSQVKSATGKVSLNTGTAMGAAPISP